MSKHTDYQGNKAESHVTNEARVGQGLGAAVAKTGRRESEDQHWMKRSEEKKTGN